MDVDVLFNPTSQTGTLNYIYYLNIANTYYTPNIINIDSVVSTIRPELYVLKQTIISVIKKYAPNSDLNSSKAHFTHIVKTSWQIHHYFLYNFYYMFKYKGGSLPIGGVICPRV